jgi:hypothetical protein
MGIDISVYFDGKAQAGLVPERAPQEYRRIPGVIDNLNQVFEIYFIARSNLDRSYELGITSNQKWAMRKELEECADNGWRSSWIGWGGRVNCLRHAFEHLVKNHGGWTETYSGSYKPDPPKPWSPYQPSTLHGGIYAPTAVMNFMDAFDGILEKSVKAVGELKAQAQRLERESLRKFADKFRHGGESAQKSAAKESELELKEIVEKAETIHKGLVLTATGSQLLYIGKKWTDTLAEFGEAIEKYDKVVDQFTKIGNVGNDLVEGVNTYSNAQNAGMSDGAAATLAVLERALKFVPVLGEGYAEVIAGMPATAGFVRDRAENLKIAMQTLHLE